jgi:hypothetical protein
MQGMSITSARSFERLSSADFAGGRELEPRVRIFNPARKIPLQRFVVLLAR